MNNRQLVRRFAEAVRERDVEAICELMHPDIVLAYPQSGEVIRGSDNYRAMLMSYPSGVPDAEVAEPRGTTESVHVSSPIPFGIPTITVVGSGDTFILEGTADHPDQGPLNFVSIVTVRDGKLAEEVTYFAAPFDPPEWRRPFVEV